ncbi:MAG: T9SS type A sorting domain-containing protein [Bacteroidales bacterium]|jgi:hypothetical protein|nr:T9SS type A sorting domain-containing protein [Bacteroidales bacterium]MDY0015025.1 T9SS type A sorting domain-containing protein [Bacteroidales bacterium]
MKRSIFLVLALTAGMSLQAQNYVNLRFTSQMQGGSFQALDSVKIANVTRGWEQTIYYPDTVLQMINSTGIYEVKNQGNALMQNVPNPFNGNTKVFVSLSTKENVTISLYDISGKQCAVYNSNLSAGKHGFTVSVGAAQAYILTLKTSQGEQNIKLLASQSGNGFGIQYGEYISSTVEKQQKAGTTDEFQTNDSMKFIGYTTYNGGKRNIQKKTIQTGSDTMYRFQFSIGYAVGDVYYDDYGIAEGVVCWIADTVLSDNSKMYGSSGKIISLNEPDSLLMYATVDHPTHAIDTVDGRVNTALQMALRSDTSTYVFKERIEAAKWCTDKGEGWYFPAKYEMISMFQNFDVLNATLESIAATPISEYVVGSDNVYYWTSTENPIKHQNGWFAYGIVLFDNAIQTGNSSFFVERNVRAMKWFGE